MQSRATRFWLRFHTGARQGERVPLEPGVVTLGRRPDNTIAVNDGSVSGHHAELTVGEAGAVLKDLGSTNGTKVRGQRITTADLAPGDTFLLGTVRMTLETEAAEGELGDPAEPAEPAGIEIEGLDEAPSLPAPAADVVESIGAEQMARARSRSKAAPVLLVLLVAACGVAAWRFWPRAETSGPALAPRAIPGDLLGYGSFEEGAEAAGEEEAFVSVAAAPQGFQTDVASARSGRFGLGATLAAGEWALARSGPFALVPEKRAVLRAAVSADPGTLARIGVELSSSAGTERARILWGEPLAGEGSFVESELAFTTWAGFDRARVCLAALGEGAGSVAFDDVSVVVEETPFEPAATFNEFAAARIGSAAVIVRSGSLLLGPIELGRWSEAGLEGFARASFAVEAAPNGFVLRASESPAGTWLHLLGPRGGGGGGGGAESGAARVATLGPDGYQSHTSEFERAGAAAVLIGEGLDLVKVTFAHPLTVRGSTRDGVPWIAAEVGPDGAIDVQLSFREERAEASLLEARARAAESAGDYGASLAAWSELLDRVPFEARLVETASGERAKRLQAGLEGLSSLTAEFERGRFFQLAELYRDVRGRTEALCTAYAGSEVERGGRALIGDIEAALAGFGAEDEAARARRVSALLGVLDRERFPLLRARVEAELESSGAPED